MRADSVSCCALTLVSLSRGWRERTTEITLHYTDNRRAHVGTVCTDPHIKRISPRMLSYSKSYWIRARPPPPEDPTLGKVKLSGGFFAITLVRRAMLFRNLFLQKTRLRVRSPTEAIAFSLEA